jgi:hypothetical protein
MAKERDNSSGRYVEKATLDDVLAVFDAVEGPPVVTSADVADATNLSRDSARRKLETLRDQGRVDKRKTAGRVLYWPADAIESREHSETPSDDNAVVTTTKSDEQNVAPNTRRDVETSDVLEGWTHGRSESERDASRRVALDATEWLREHGECVKKSDVPLDEFADSDPEDRSTKTLWTEVVLDAWQHAIERGFIEQPKARHYQWSTPDT